MRVEKQQCHSQAGGVARGAQGDPGVPAHFVQLAHLLLEPGAFLQTIEIRVNQRFPIPRGNFPPLGLRGHLQELPAGDRWLRQDLE